MQVQNCLKISFNIMKQKFKVVSNFSNLHIVLAQTNPNTLSTIFFNIRKNKIRTNESHTTFLKIKHI